MLNIFTPVLESTATTFDGTFNTSYSSTSGNYSLYSHTEPFQENVNNVSQNIYNQSNNLGFGIGRFIGRLLGTVSIAENTAYLPIRDMDMGKDFSNNEQIEFNDQGWLSSIATFAQKMLRYPTKHKKGVIFKPAYDHNGATFMQSDLETDLDASIASYRISHPDQICNILTRNGEKNDYFIINAHGSPDSIQFGSSPYDVLDFDNIEKDLYCLKDYLSSDAKIILLSCSTAAIENLPLGSEYQQKEFSFSDYILSRGQGNIALAIARYLTKIHPEINVYAPSLDAFGCFVDSLYPFELTFASSKPEGVNFDKGFNDGTVNSRILHNSQTIALIDKIKQNQFFGFNLPGSKDFQDQLVRAMKYVPAQDQYHSTLLVKSLIYVLENILIGKMILALLYLKLIYKLCRSNFCTVSKTNSQPDIQMGELPSNNDSSNISETVKHTGSLFDLHRDGKGDGKKSDSVSNTVRKSSLRSRKAK